jgi:NADP-dependent 3-hydroxy acid dehydrogenase YdfG
MSGSGPRTALVTGASRGIGRAVAQALAAQGIRVAMIARTEHALRDAAAPLGTNAFTVECDVTDPRAIDAMADRVRAEFNDAPDVLVNNAGLFRLSAAHATEPADFADALDVNLVAPFRVIRAFLPAMRDRKRGHVVNIGSIADRVAFPENGAYAASKFGLRGLHQVLRAEVGNSGVRATLVSPGPVDTSLWDEIDPDNRPGFSPRSSMLRPEAVAAAVLYAVLQPAEVNVDELRLSRS